MYGPGFGPQHHIKLSLYCIPLIPTLRKWKQEDQKFKAILSYKVFLHYKASSDQPGIHETPSTDRRQTDRDIRRLERWLSQ